MRAIRDGASSEWASASAARHDHRLIWMAQPSWVVSRFASARETRRDHELSQRRKDHGRGQVATATQERSTPVYRSLRLPFLPEVYIQKNRVRPAPLAMASRPTRLLLDKSR